jgi:phage tail sheath protein FI
MPVQLTYPGVYVQEISSGVVAISTVATSIALFVGRTQRGPWNRPQLVLNRTSYESQFGTDTTIGEMTDQVRQFFLNGGNQAYIMRIANNPGTSGIDVFNEFGALVIHFDAADPGKLGDTIRIRIDYNTSRPETNFNLTAYREITGSGGQIQQTETEVFRELSVDPNSAVYVVNVLNQQSRLITASVATPVPASFNGFTIGGVLGTSAAELNTRIVAAINQAITNAGAGAQVGRFDISVDEQPFVTVGLPNTITGVADIQNLINAATAPLGVTVAVNALQIHAAPDLFALQIVSQQTPPTPNSSVRTRRAATPDDVAGLLQLTTDDGGIEVSGGTYLRPMPNGIVGRLSLTAAPPPPFIGVDLKPLLRLLTEAPGAVTGITLTDSAPVSTGTFAFPARPTLLDDATAGHHSLASGRANLDAIVSALNAAFTAVQPQRWTASRTGYRIVLTSNLGMPDLGPGTTIATSGGGAYHFDAVPRYLTAVAAPTDQEANVAAYRLGQYGGPGPGTTSAFPYSRGTGAGNDGNKPQLIDYTGAFDIVRREVDLFSLLVLPRDQLQNDSDRASLWGPASAFCNQRRAVLLMDPQSDQNTGWTDINKAKAGVIAARTGVIRDYAAVYWPRLMITDPLTGAQRPIDPAGTVAGICSRIDASRGVWKAPAGLEATLVVRGVERRMSNEENGVINPEALNAIRAFPNGIVVWGARTMDGFDNSGNTDYRYLPVRRTALMIEESLYRGLQFAVFQPNDDRLWAQIRLAAGSFMNGLFRQGAFQGQKASDAYFVKCDSETTTQTDINLGIVNVLVGFAPLRPAEFVVLTIQQKAGQVQT